jgi:type IV conjugative transfer system protein TraL
MHSEHVILNYLDTPARILFWPVSEFVTVLIPTFILIMMGHPILALILGGLFAWGIRLFKRSFGSGMLEGVMYWHFVHNRPKYPITPPSYIREFIG